MEVHKVNGGQGSDEANRHKRLVREWRAAVGRGNSAEAYAALREWERELGFPDEIFYEWGRESAEVWASLGELTVADITGEMPSTDADISARVLRRSLTCAEFEQMCIGFRARARELLGDGGAL